MHQSIDTFLCVGTSQLELVRYQDLAYLAAAVLFILGLKMLGKVKTAARGNLVSSLGMLLACGVTLFHLTGQTLVSLVWVGAAVAVGAGIGLILAMKVPMTGMPQMVALLNGFGGIASLLVACGDHLNYLTMSLAERVARGGGVVPEGMGLQITQSIEGARTALPEALSGLGVRPAYEIVAIGLAVLIGGVTFTGSLVAFGKLQGLRATPSAPVQLPGQKIQVALLTAVGLVMCGALVALPETVWPLGVIAAASLLLGVLLVMGIGGADMPVVISLLNSYSGLAAAMAGFVLGNMVLIITGALVGASGIILTNIMCKAMNRSLVNVLFGGVGFESTGVGGAAADQAKGEVRRLTPEDAAIVLDAATSVVIVPGYGMAVAQAQHGVKDLADQLERRGISVKYAIHPVAGRMPGHMNVLLAEANVPYEQLCDLDTINPEFPQVDVALVIGANDVTNPAARHAKDSPIYGMPILDVDKARQVFVIKRSMNPGFAGVENELYYRPNCSMIFGDAKKVVGELVAHLKEE